MRTEGKRIIAAVAHVDAIRGIHVGWQRAGEVKDSSCGLQMHCCDQVELLEVPERGEAQKVNTVSGFRPSKSVDAQFLSSAGAASTTIASFLHRWAVGTGRFAVL